MTWTDVRRSCVGVPYGHVPGHSYHDVDAELKEKNRQYRLDLLESWGSAQGYDQEHGRREVSGYGDTPQEAAQRAREDAEVSGMDMSWVVQALTQVLRDDE